MRLSHIVTVTLLTACATSEKREDAIHVSMASLDVSFDVWFSDRMTQAESMPLGKDRDDTLTRLENLNRQWSGLQFMFDAAVTPDARAGAIADACHFLDESGIRWR